MLTHTSLLYPEVKIVRKLPADLKKEDAYLFEGNITQTLKPVSLYHYTDVNITPEGVVFNWLSVKTPLLIFPDHKSSFNALFLLKKILTKKRVSPADDNKYLLVFDYWSHGLYHWMCDVLPRLQAVKDDLHQYTLLLPQAFEADFIAETLKAFGITKIFRIEQSSYLHCRNLFVPGHIARSGDINPGNFSALRQTLITYFKTRWSTKARTPANIYVSRNKARFRRVINEPGVVEILKRYDFEVIHYEDHSFTEQVQIAYNAKNIIGIHGANLTNCMFMQPGSNMLELRRKKTLGSNFYYSLADAVKCNYFYMECEYEGPANGVDFDVMVNTTELESKVRHMLSVTKY